MADNFAFTPAGASTGGSDDVGGVHYPRVKVVWGPDGTVNDTDVATGKPIPAQLRVSDGTAWTYGSGAVSAGTPRVILATDDTLAATTKVDDAAFTPGTSRVLVIGAEADETAADSVDEGDAGALRMTLERALHVNMRATGGAEIVATALGQAAAAASLPVVLATNDPAVTSLAILDDGDETDRAKVNIIAGQVAITGGAGAVAANTPRATLASDDPAVVALQIIDDWDESDRAKVNPIVGQAGVAAGSGTNGVTVQRVTVATDDTVATDLTAIKTAIQIVDDWDSTDAAKVVGITDNPTAVYTRPADTTAYTAGDLVSNNTTAGSITVQSFAASRVTAGSGLIRRIRLTSNHTTGLSAIQFKVRLWTTAPTYTNGDNGAYAVATGAAGYIGSFLATFEQFADGATAIGAPTVGAEVAFKLGSGTAIFWDMEAITGFTPQSAKTFTIAAEILQD